jgi:hypothetical protein
MTELTAFERRLADRLNEDLAGSVLDFDAAAIARHAMTPRGVLDRLRHRLGLADPLGTGRPRLLAIGGVVALLLVGTLVALAIALAPRPTHRLALVLANGEVALARADGTEATAVARPRTQFPVTHVLWAPDGEHLALRDDLRTLVILDRTGRLTYQAQLRDPAASIAWSPDGGRLAILDGEVAEGTSSPRSVGLQLIDPNGQPAGSVELPAEFTYPRDLASIAWSPDGRTIALAGSATSGGADSAPSFLWVADPYGGSARQLTKDPDSFDHGPAWADGGTLYIGRNRPGERAIWRIDSATGNAEAVYKASSQVCELCPITSIDSIAPDRHGVRLAYIDPNGLAILDLESGKARASAAAGSNIFGPIHWSGDGSSVILLSMTAPDGLPIELLSIDASTDARTVIVSGVFGYDLREAD